MHNLSHSLSIILILITCLASCEIYEPVHKYDQSNDSLDIVGAMASRKLYPDSNEYYFKKASSLAGQSNRNRAIFLGILGKEMILSGNLDSAGAIANQGLKLDLETSSIGLKGKFYNIKGNIEGFKKNVYQSIDYYIQAEKLYEIVDDSSSLAGIYNNIANAYFSLKDYKSAHQFAAKAFNLLSSVRESNIISNILTTYGLSLNKVGEVKEAFPYVLKADSLADATENKMGKLASTIGLAELYNSNRQFDSAEYYYNQCISLASTLGVQHFVLVSQMGLLGMYETQHKYREINKLAPPTIILAKQLQNVDVLHTAKRMYGKALEQEGQYKEGIDMLSESYRLYDSVAGIENQKNINELLVKYDAEKNEKEILNQKLLLARQKVELRKRQLIILVLVLGLSIFILIYIYIQKLNNERLKRSEIEKQKKISDAYIAGEIKERTRLAFEIHDGIASMLTGISYKLRAEDANKNEVIGLISELHEETRRMSHSLMPINFELNGFFSSVASLCDSMSTSKVEVILLGNELVININQQSCLLIYRLIQEIINNALKHAQCKSIFVGIVADREKSIEVSVQDDGIGLEQDVIENGFRSIRERVDLLGATLSIVSKKAEGTRVSINYIYE